MANKVGDNKNNKLIGTLDDDRIDGKGGNDQLVGQAGDDEIYGRAGNDVLDGGDGDDRSSGIDFLDLPFDPGGLYGGAGNDILYGGDGTDELYGDAGNDILYGGDGDDRSIIGGLDEPPFLGGDLYGGQGNDILYGEDGSDDLDGDEGNDTLKGGRGSDELDGGQGNDALSGGAGTDILTGGGNNDTLTGNQGADTFSFYSPNWGLDIITDFSSAGDTIQVERDNFGGDLQSGAITAEQFRLGASAKDAQDRFIYNQNTGALFFDSDGTGSSAKIRFATLAKDALVTRFDIDVV